MQTRWVLYAPCRRPPAVFSGDQYVPPDTEESPICAHQSEYFDAGFEWGSGCAGAVKGPTVFPRDASASFWLISVPSGAHDPI